MVPSKKELSESVLESSNEDKDDAIVEKDILTTESSEDTTPVVKYLDHAKVELMHCLADGLFRPIKKGIREQKPLNVSIELHTAEVTLWWRNYALLGIDDQSIFLALHRLFVTRSECLPSKPSDATEKRLRELLETQYQAANLDTAMVKTSLSEIARVAGLSHSGPNIQAVAHSLLRLSGVDFVVYKTGDLTKRAYQAKLISFFDISNGDVRIALNPMLMHAILGSRNAYIDMSVQRALSNDAAKRLHVWLSGWASENRTQQIALDKLITHVWGDDDPNYIRKRRLSLRSAIQELGSSPGWVCFEDDDKKVHVRKPKFVGTRENVVENVDIENLIK